MLFLQTFKVEVFTIPTLLYAIFIFQLKEFIQNMAILTQFVHQKDAIKIQLNHKPCFIIVSIHY